MPAVPIEAAKDATAPATDGGIGWRELLQMVTPRERQVLKLRFEGNNTYEEIGKAIGRSSSRAEQLLKRALGIIRDRLGMVAG